MAHDADTPERTADTALAFDGRDDFVVLGPAEVLRLPGESFTAEAWVRLAADGGEGDRPIFGTDETSQNAGLHLVLRDRRPRFAFYANDTDGRTVLPTESWTHLAFRYDAAAGEQAIFVNGVLDAASAGHAPFAGTGLVRLGRWGSRFHFAGAMTEVRLWGRALSAAEIAAGMYRRATGEEPGLTACWPLDDGAGATGRNLRTAAPARLAGGAGWAPAPSGGFADPGGAMAHLPGSGAEIVIPSAPELDLPRDADFTVEAWLAARSEEQAAADLPAAVLGKRGASGAYPFALELAADGTLVATRSDGAHEVRLASRHPVGDGRLHHLALARAGSELVLFVDGAEEARAPDAVTGRVGNPEPVRLGSFAGTGRFLRGSVGELRIWNRARTPQEIQEAGARRLRGDEGGLVGYWPLGDGQGEEAENRIARAVAELQGVAWLPDSGVPLLPAAPAALGAPPTAPALAFDGDGDHVAFPAARALDFPRGLSVEAWVRPGRTGGELWRSPVVSCHGTAAGFELRASGGGAGFMVTTDRRHHEVEADSGLVPERWVHLAGTYDGQTAALYVNGVLKASRPTPGAYTPYPDELRLGQSSFWTDRSFAGQLAEVRLWERARSGEEILRDLHRRLGPEGAPGLLGRWPLDEASGTEAADHAAGQRFAGTLSGAAWVAADLPPRLGAAAAAPAPSVDAAVLVHDLGKRNRELEAELERSRREAEALELRRRDADRTGSELGAKVQELERRLAAVAGIERELEAERRERRDLVETVHRQEEKAGAVSLATLIRNTNREIEAARAELAGRGAAYRLGRVTMELRMLPGPGGSGAIFPSPKAMDHLRGDQLSKLDLEFESERPPEAPEPPQATVPELAGLTETVARRKLAEAGLLVEASFQAVPPAGADKDLAGRVVNQLPPPGEKVALSTTVHVFIGQAS
jgi:hypothetical protein